MTATDNSTIRSFVRKQVMNDRANPTTLPAAEPVVSIDAGAPAQLKDQPRAKTTILGQVPATQPVKNVIDDANTEPADKTPATQPTVTVSTNDPKDDQGNNPDKDDQ